MNNNTTKQPETNHKSDASFGRDTIFSNPDIKELVPGKHVIRRSMQSIQKNDQPAQPLTNTTPLQEGIFKEGGRKKFAVGASLDTHNSNTEPSQLSNKREKAPGIYNTEALRRENISISSQQNSNNKPNKAIIPKSSNLNQSNTTQTSNASTNSAKKPSATEAALSHSKVNTIGPSPQKIRTFFNENNHSSNKKSPNPFEYISTVAAAASSKPQTSASSRPVSSYLSSKNITRTFQNNAAQDLYNSFNVKPNNSNSSTNTRARAFSGSGSGATYPSNNSSSNISSNRSSNIHTFQPVISENPIFNKTPPPIQHRNIHVNKVGSFGSSSFYMQ